MKISNLPKATRSKKSDLLTIVQGDTTKNISVKDFTQSITRELSKLANELKNVRSNFSKKAFDKNNPTLSKNLKVPSPKLPSHAATKGYVDKMALHTVRVDGTTKIDAPLSYSKSFDLSDKNLITKEYADGLLDFTLKKVANLHSNSYPKAKAGDVFISRSSYDSFGADGPAIEEGDLIVCITNSEGGTHGAAGSQFAILNTNVVQSSESTKGIIRIANDKEVLEFDSDESALTPKKYKDSLISSSLYNRTVVETSAYSLVESEKGIIAVDNRRSDCVITLPSASSLKHPELFKTTIKDEFGQSDLRNITIKSLGSTIDAKNQIVLANKYQAVTIYNDGINYYIENNTHPEDTASGLLSRAGIVYAAGTGSDEALYSFDIDLSQFDQNQGFSFEVSGFFAGNGNTKTLKLVVDGTTVVTNATTTAPNSKFFVARATILKEPRYAVAYGYVLLDGIAADTVNTNGLNMDWTSSVTVSAVSNCATTNTDIHIYSAILQPLK
tara:strand:- start:3803 stop:5299 length:1497 start_codon:yes stop_codon:yes gene_type:complete